MKKKIEVEINTHDRNEKQCGSRRGNGDWCDWLEKQSGTYHCVLFDVEVDQGDDEEHDDYLFMRCPACVEATKKVAK